MLSPKKGSMNIWYHLHGAITHFPIAAALLSFAFDYGAVILKKPTFRTVGFWLLIVGAIASVFGVITGLITAREWSAPSMMQHRNTAYIAAGLLTILALWRGLKKDALKGTEFIAYLVAVAAAAAAVGLTGFLGGKVVMSE